MSKRLFICLLTLVFLFSTSVGAMAGTKPSNSIGDLTKIIEKDKNSTVIEKSKNDVVYTASNKNVDKEQYLKTIESLNPVMGAYTTTLSNTDKHNYGNSYCQADFSDNLNVTLSDVTLGGTSHGYWMGTSPSTMADNIQISDTINFGGFMVSVNSNGGNWVLSDTTLTWTSPWVADNWIISHSYSNINASGLSLGVSQTTSASFQFGSTFITPSATSSKSL